MKNRLLLEEMLTRQDKLSETLDETEEYLLGHITPREFTKKIEFEIIFGNKNIKNNINSSDPHISIYTALERYAEFPTHSHKTSKDTIVIIKGSAMVNINGNFIYTKEGDTIPVPPNVPHGGFAIEAGTQVSSIVVPSDPDTLKFYQMIKETKGGGH